MTDAATERLSTGIEGFDAVLHGGLIPHRSYMLTGRPGTGKTVLGLHYLAAGRDDGETGLYINLEESAAQIRENAATLGIDLDGVEFLDLSPEADVFTANRQYDIFEPDEVEGPGVAGLITDRVRDVEPDRVFVDPITQLGTLAPSDHQFRAQITGFVRFVKSQGATLLFTSPATDTVRADELQFISDGTIELARPDHGRTLTVAKFRGSDTSGGPHAVRISDTGMAVYPVLSPENFHREFSPDAISSGVPGIDEMLHGGVERGTVTILSGPTGVGKTTLGTQFMKEAAGTGTRSVIYQFEEDTRTLLSRAESVNIPVETMIERGTLSVTEVEPLEQSPEEFAAMVREEVEERDARIVMIDGIEGYRLSLRGGEAALERELNLLCRYLKNMGVTVILVDSVDAITGEFQPTKSGVSYIADTIVFLRYIEIEGELRKAFGVLKCRTSDFERTLREFQITEYGVTVGDPLSSLRGILSGTPESANTAASRPGEGDDRGTLDR